MANGTIAASQLEMLTQSGTGIITIVPPATNTNRTLTLPDATGTVVASGTTPSLNGIAFPATQVPSADANTLDDYEEGTFTATLTGDTTAPSTPVTTTGYYTKIGNTVIVSVYFNNVNTTGASGTARITGFPFANSGNVASVGSGWNNRIATSLTVIWINASATSVSFLDSLGNALVWASVGTGTYTNITVAYRI